MPPRQIRAKATDADRQSNPNDSILDRSVALNTTVSGLTHLTGLTSSDGCTAEGNADAPSAVTDQSGSPLLRMRDEAKRESFALMDNIGLGDVFPNSASTSSKRQHQHEEEQSKASGSKLETYLSKKGRAWQKSHKSKKSRKTMADDDQECQGQAALHPQAQGEAQKSYTLDDPASEEYKAALLASSEYTSFDDNSAISRRHHLNKAQGWFPWELDALSEQVGEHLEQPNDAKPAARSMNNTKFAGVASPAADADHGRHHPEEPTAGVPASFSQWGHTAARTARTLLGRCHVFMDEHDVDEWIDTATSTFHKALRAGRAQCVASCNNAGP